VLGRLSFYLTLVHGQNFYKVYKKQNLLKVNGIILFQDLFCIYFDFRLDILRAAGIFNLTKAVII
jgi:hypothetical protein